MKLRLTITLAGLLIAIGVCAQTNSYMVVAVRGYTAIANQLNHGGNTLSEVLGTVPAGTMVYRQQSDGSFGLGAVFNAGTGWNDSDNPDGTGGPGNGPTLAPGQGAFIYNPTEQPFTIIFSGTVVTNISPLTLNCGQFYFVSRQTNGQGTFENITGTAAQDGAEVFIYNGNDQGDISDVFNSYQMYVSVGGGWYPELPVAEVGEAVFVRKCCPNGCLTISRPDIVNHSAVPTGLDFAMTVSDSCDSAGSTNFYNMASRPSAGSGVFYPGTTPTHAVAVDAEGNVASCDFNVTISPPAKAAPQDFYNLNIETGSNLIACHFIIGGNTLGEVLSDFIDGSVVSKYDSATGNWVQSVYDQNNGGWNSPNITLLPGEGAVLVSPTTYMREIDGTPVTPAFPLVIHGDIALVSSQTNGQSTYEDVTGTSPVAGTVVYRLISQNYVAFTYDGANWSPDTPILSAGESWWISPLGTAAPPGVPLPPTISEQPTNTTVNLGNEALFAVMATGTEPFSYQWRLNGNPIIGETNDTLVIASAEPANCGVYDVLVQNLIGIADSTNASLSLSNAVTLPFSDLFNAAGALPGTTNGFGVGNNFNATLSDGEPSPGFIPGGASVWATWQAPATGVATFSTAGSSIDTLLAVYAGSSLSNLTAVASDDDNAGYLWSEVSFNAAAGSNYSIQVDGFYGAMGNITLSWNLQATTGQLPVIVQQPRSETVGLKGTANFTVTVQTNNLVTYQWLRDGLAIAGATNATISITDVEAPQVGVYQVQVTSMSGGLSVTTFPAQLQINIPDNGQPINTEARAGAKLTAVLDQTVLPNDPYDPPTVSGFTGTQIFSSYGAGLETNDPIPCGVTCYNTTWHSYMSPSSGLMVVSNPGTAYNGVLSVYTPQNNVLAPLACSMGHGAGNETVSFEAQGGTTYAISMSATNPNVSGAVVIKYAVLTPPSFNLLPISQTQPSGSNVTLTVAATGNPAVSYQWLLNGTNIPGATGASLHLNPPGDTNANFQAVNEGNYSVLATNTAGSTFFMFTPVYLNSDLVFVNPQVGQYNFATQLLGKPNSNYVFESSSDNVNWQPLVTGSSSTGLINFTDNYNSSVTNLFYRAKLLTIP